MSPTVLESGPYRFFFYSNERDEPPHVHVKRDAKIAKFWLNPVREAYNDGFKAVELNRIAAMTRHNEAALAKAWVSTSSVVTEAPLARHVRVTDRALVVELRDGRVVSVPIEWYPRLAEGTRRERSHWTLLGPGSGIHWPDLDEDVSIDGLLQGRPSHESATSLRKWRAARGRSLNESTGPAPRTRGKKG
jgi:hypothetical protein